MDKLQVKPSCQNLFACDICHNSYEDPRILPCEHTFCFTCIQKANSDVCPLCQQPWTASGSSLRTLPHDFTLESFKLSLLCITKCGFESEISHGCFKYFCLDCWEPLCAECKLEHAKFTKNHNIK